MFKRFILVLFLLLLPFSAMAQTKLPTVEPLPGEKDVGAAISPLKKGQIAPFTGVLLSPKAVASVIAELDSFGERIKIETDKTKGEDKAQCDFQVNSVKIQAEADAKVAQAKLDEALKRVEIFQNMVNQQQSTSSDPLLWGGLGFGIGVAATILIVYASNHVTQ
jgi:hypothetical protein